MKEGADDYFYTRDHLGSLVNLTDTSLTLRARYAYDPYGRGIRTTGNRDADIGFTGHMIDRDADLTLTYFRGYDPSLGRWLSRDPLGLSAGPNAYAYGGGDPVGTVDPLGLHPLVAFLVGGAIVGLATQAIADFSTGSVSSWQSYAAAGVGGAAGGAALLYSTALVAGLAGGAATNLARQALDWGTGNRCKPDLLGFAAETAFGGLMGKVGPMIAPFTTGNGSLAHVGRTQVTRFLRGQTNSWAPSTLAKMFLGRSADQGVFPSMVPAGVIGGSGALQSSGVGVSVDDKPAFLRVRVSRTPYAVFGTIWGGLSIPFLIAARTEPSFLSLAIVALGTCGGFFLWLSRYRLEVNDGILTYRTLFTGCRSLPVKDIARLKAVSGYESMKDDTKPFFRVVVEPKAGTPYANLSINLNVFKRDDINHLKQFLSGHGVDVRDA